jgi:hypothetical protein
MIYPHLLFGPFDLSVVSESDNIACVLIRVTDPTRRDLYSVCPLDWIRLWSADPDAVSKKIYTVS